MSNSLHFLLQKQGLIAITNHSMLYTNLKSFSLKVEYVSDSILQHSWRSRIRSLIHSLPYKLPAKELLLIVSPLKGIVTANRIITFIKKIDNPTSSYAPMSLLKANQNPIRLNMISKNHKNGCFVTTNNKNSTLDLRSTVKKEHAEMMSKYTGSQFLPDLYSMDEALILTKKCFLEDNNKKLTPVLAPVSGKETMPFLYRLPIFNFSKNTNLSY